MSSSSTITGNPTADELIKTEIATETKDKVSKNAMLSLFAFAALFGVTILAFTYILVEIDFKNIPGEIIGFFSGTIGVLGTIVGTLINRLYGGP